MVEEAFQVSVINGLFSRDHSHWEKPGLRLRPQLFTVVGIPERGMLEYKQGHRLTRYKQWDGSITLQWGELSRYVVYLEVAMVKNMINMVKF